MKILAIIIGMCVCKDEQNRIQFSYQTNFGIQVSFSERLYEAGDSLMLSSEPEPFYVKSITPNP